MNNLKRILTAVLLALLVFFIIASCVNAKADSNPSATGQPVDITGAVAVSPTGEVTAIDPASYTMTVKGYSQINTADNLGSIVDNLDDVAKQIDPSYNSSVFVPFSSFELTVNDTIKNLVAQGYYVAIKFDLGNEAKQDGKYTVIHQNEETGEWIALEKEDIHLSEDGKTLECYFDSFCPVVILAVNEDTMVVNPNIALYIAGGIAGLAVVYLVFTLLRRKKSA